MLDEVDLDIVAALQLAPRTPLNTLAEVLGGSPNTIGRRIQRMHQRGLLRVTSTLDWPLIMAGMPRILWIRCAPGAVRAVAGGLEEIADVQTILITSGGADIYCTVYPLLGTDIPRLLTETIPTIAGIVSVQVHLVLRPARGTRDWRLRRLTEEQEATLRDHGSLPAADPVPSLDRLSELERGALRLLIADGRVTAAEVARELGVSRSTAYRLTQTLLERGVARPRVQVEPATLGFPLTAVIALNVLPGNIPDALDALSRPASVRFVAMTAGPASILYQGVFRNEEELAGFVTEDLGGLAGVTALNMTTALRVVRRQWIGRDGAFLGQRVLDAVRP